MTTRLDAEETASTRSEKVLAVVLAVFLLIGTCWFYVQVADWVAGEERWDYTAAEQTAIDDFVEADDAAWRAEEERDQRLTDLDQARADLDLALGQGDETDELRTRYEVAQQAYTTAREDADEARDAADAAQEKADAAEDSYAERTGEQSGVYWVVALIRLVFVGALLGGTLRLLSVTRQRESRYLVLALAGVVTAAVMALVFAVDYITDYVDLLDLGPIVLSVLGAAATIAAFVGLQRYLARRVPRSRVRKGECPFCAFPVRTAGQDAGPHCEGCGREVVAACSTCAAPRRVGTPHCGHCGSA